MTTAATKPALDLEAIEARHAATTQGPWHWSGNTDSGNEALSGWEPGVGRCEVVSTVEVERKATDKRQINSIVSGVIDCDVIPSFLRDHDEWADEWDEQADHLASDIYRARERFIYDTEDGNMRPEVSDALDRAAVKEWLGEDEYGTVRKDTKLALTTPDHWRKAVSEVAVYEVARNQGLPDDTPREHSKVYRADICDVRNPNGQFLASSWTDVRDLLAEVKRLRQVESAVRWLATDLACEGQQSFADQIDAILDAGEPDA